MKHICFTQSNTVNTDKVSTAILLKESSLNPKEISKHYIRTLSNTVSDASEQLLAFSLDYSDDGKPLPIKKSREYAEKLLKGVNKLGIKYLYVCDAHYYLVLTGNKSISHYYHLVQPCIFSGFEHIKIIAGANYSQLFVNPKVQETITNTLNLLSQCINGNYVKPNNQNIIHSLKTPSTTTEIQDALDEYQNLPILAWDIETFSLDITSDIGTVAFAKDEHNAIAYSLSLQNIENPEDRYKSEFNSILYKEKLLLTIKFLKNYKGKILFHNGNFDVKILIYRLYIEYFKIHKPKSFIDLIESFNFLKNRNYEDTKLITYCANNSTIRHSNALKDNIREYLGNYAIDQDDDTFDITLHTVENVLEYNALDAMGTFWLYKKEKPILIRDQQERVYNEILLPSIKVILLMELTGMPVDMDQVYKVEKELLKIKNTALDNIKNSAVTKKFNTDLQLFAQQAANEKLKTKFKLLVEFTDIEFNPGSSLQLVKLFHEKLGLPVLAKTAKGNPSIGADTLESLKHHTKDTDILFLLDNIIEFAGVINILSTFIEAFKKALLDPVDNIYYLHGNFNLGTVVSSRLSSSNPNLQNIPSNSKHAKLIKTCFIGGTKDQLLVGIDFDSLEDKISGLNSKDSNKLKVYIENYDGHSLRTFNYFKDQLPDIVNTKESINSIADKYPLLRFESKAPTFALTYLGTWHTLVKNCGFTPEKAKAIEKAYHNMYKTYDKWVHSKIKQASIDGYITAAFGLRVRTPLLAQVVIDSNTVPYKALKESRTAGNALGQSWGMLNNRAAIEFYDRLVKSPYKNLIRPTCQVHDSQYFSVARNVDVLKWFNTNIVECIEWQEDPAIQHDKVKISGTVEVFYKNWSQPFKIPNRSSIPEIRQACRDGIHKYTKG